MENFTTLDQTLVRSVVDVDFHVVFVNRGFVDGEGAFDSTSFRVT